jgi:DNA-binding LacI/PurR family transcriptional regulator
MNDVARLAGVSYQTVSRVVNRHPSVSTETRTRVLVAIEQLNYRPNALARGLVAQRSKTIGVLIFDTALHGPSTTLVAVERAARAADYGVSVATVSRGNSGSLKAALGALRDSSVDGLLAIAPSRESSLVEREIPDEMPLVSLAQSFNDVVPVVAVDLFAGAELATGHLVGLGHRAVWHLAGPPDWPEAQQRIEGWRNSLDCNGALAPPLIRGDWTPQSGYEAGLALGRRDNVTAVFAANDQMALGLLHAFNELGIRVPEDVSVVGFDDEPEAAYFIPSLTTIRQDFEALGRRGVENLLAMLQGADYEPPARIAPELVVRKSTAPPRER